MVRRPTARYYRLDADDAPRPCTKREWLESVRGGDAEQRIDRTVLYRRGRAVAEVITLFCGRIVPGVPADSAMFRTLVHRGARSLTVGDDMTKPDALARHASEVARLQHEGYRVLPCQE